MVCLDTSSNLGIYVLFLWFYDRIYTICDGWTIKLNIIISMAPKFSKLSYLCLAYVDNLVIKLEGNFSNFKKILSNFNSAFIIQFGYFWAMIFQFLALRNPLPKFFFYKIGVKWCFVVCANSLLLPEHYLTPWVFIWSHANVLGLPKYVRFRIKKKKQLRNNK